MCVFATVTACTAASPNLHVASHSAKDACCAASSRASRASRSPGGRAASARSYAERSRAAAGLTIGDQAGGQAGALPTPAPIVWGSFERNTGTWCPYPDSAKIEAAYQRGDAAIFLPECFNAHVHFNRTGPHHHQTTPAVGAKPAGYPVSPLDLRQISPESRLYLPQISQVGAKPAGYRSVLRGTPGEQALLWARSGSGRSVPGCAAPIEGRGHYETREALPWSEDSLAQKLERLRAADAALDLGEEIVDREAGLWHTTLTCALASSGSASGMSSRRRAKSQAPEDAPLPRLLNLWIK